MKIRSNFNAPQNIFIRVLPNSGTEVTVGTVALRIADFSSEGADLLHRLSPDSSTMFGRTRVWPAPLLGPQVLPFTPSAGTGQ